MTAARLKAQASVIRTRAELEAVLEEIATLTAQKQIITGQLNNERTMLESKYDQLLSPIDASLKGLLARSEDWADVNKAEFGKAKSIDMTHGKIGWRIGNPTLKLLNKKWSWEKVLSALQSLGTKTYVREKPEVNKELLLADREKLGDEGLAQFGVRVDQAESFFIEPNVDSFDTKLKEAS